VFHRPRHLRCILSNCCLSGNYVMPERESQLMTQQNLEHGRGCSREELQRADCCSGATSTANNILDVDFIPISSFPYTSLFDIFLTFSSKQVCMRMKFFVTEYITLTIKLLYERNRQYVHASNEHGRKRITPSSTQDTDILLSQ
jgi:hypothetical protein